MARITGTSRSEELKRNLKNDEFVFEYKDGKPVDFDNDEVHFASGYSKIKNFERTEDRILVGTPESDEFVFQDISRVLNYPSVSRKIHEVHVLSTDGYHKIKNFDIEKDSLVINNIGGDTNNSEAVANNSIHPPPETNFEFPSLGGAERGERKEIDGTPNADRINGTSADEKIYGRAGDDIIYGNKGYDTLKGGKGNDSLYGGSGSGELVDSGYENELYGESGNDYLSSEGQRNKLYGGAGNDTLDGSRGSYYDTLVGGTGDDTYIVNNKTFFVGFKGDIPLGEGETNTQDSDEETENTETIIEKLNGGTDTVESPVGYLLGDNLENLVLTGSDDTDGVGNALDNQIDGNAGENFLIGGKGNDRLRGHEGSDVLVGGAGRDTLIGGAGDDTLTGGAGADTFVFSSPFDGLDRITDFRWEEGDKIQISAKGFGIEQDEYDSFIFDRSTNELLFQQITTGENTSSISLSPLVFLQPGSNFVPSLDINIV